MTSAVVAALAAILFVVATGLSSMSAPAPGSGLSAAALQVSIASPAELRASQRVGERESRFWATQTASSVIVRNPGQQLRAAFTRAGVRVSVPGGRIGLSLVAFGRASGLASVPRPVLSALANRVTYAHGRLTEWYANGPIGLEQGLRLRVRPRTTARGELTFAYKLSGASRVALSGTQLTFLSSAGAPLLRYDGLRAVDARGRILPASLQLQGARLLIHVQDAGASYPVTVDPLLQLAGLPGSVRDPFPRTPGPLVLTPSTGPTLSITALGAKGGAWGPADEGNPTTEALVSLSNPASHGQITDVTPAAIGVTPTSALTASGTQAPATPSGGFTVAAGSQLNFTVPYKVTGTGSVTLNDSVTWKQGAAPGSASGMTEIVLGSSLTGTVTFSKSSTQPAANVPVTVTGTQSASGASVTKTAVTNAAGQYTFNLGPGTYRVSPASQTMPTAAGSGDCTASGGTCTVNMSQDRVANFTIGCALTLDFHTSMVATGCFEPIDFTAGTWKAIGMFRMDGIDFESPDDKTEPVVFDDQNKTIDGDQVKMSLSAPGYGSGWLAFYVPGGLHLSLPASETTHSWALSTPWSTPSALSVLNGGFLAAGSGSTTTLFGFPAHAPAVELTFTPGQTVLTMQVSFPPTTSAWLDPINGLWKTSTAGGGARVAYPTAVKVSVTANNAVGVSQITGAFSPAGVIGVNTGTYTAPGSPPPTGTVELAKIGMNWQLEQGIFHLIGVFVIHSGTASGAAKDFLAPIGGFLGRTLVTADASFKWLTAINVLGATVPLPGLTNLNVQVNNINEYIPDTPGLFWQRAGFQIGLDVSNPLGALLFGGNLGFTWGPRFKHDLLWFQELLSLDVAGSVTFDPFSVSGTADLKAANATLIHGALKIGGAGLYLEGTEGLNLNQILRIGFPASVSGTGKLWMPLDSSQSWQDELVGKVDIWKFTRDGRMVITNAGAGLCMTGRGVPSQGIYFDGSWHVGGCSGGPFASAISVGASSSAPSGGDTRGGKDAADIASAEKTFTLTARSHVSAVAVHGAGAAPQLELTGPGGLKLKVTKASPTDFNSSAGLVLNPDDDRTYVLFLHSPARGTYHLTPLHGSAAIRWVDFSKPLTPVSVKAKLHPVGCQERLSWTARPEPGQTIAFQDRGKSSQSTLKTTAAATGSLKFTPNPAAGSSEQIVADVNQQGTPRAELVVAKYSAPTGTARVTGLHAKGKSKKVTVSWGPVCAASYYYITVGSGQSKASSTTRHTHIVIAGTGRRKVTVTAVNGAGQPGKPSAITIR